MVISHSSMWLKITELREKSKTSILSLGPFTEGYLDLIEKDFFIKGVDLNTLNLIDRINLYFKGGFVHDIEFTEEEFP